MKKIAEKVAIVAQICITLVFVLTTVLYMANAIPQQENWNQNGVLNVLMIILAVAYLAISAYILYVNFSENANLKRILLFCDSDSATHATVKVINNIVKGCAKQVDGIKVKKIKIRSDEKAGFIATLSIEVTADSVAENVNRLRTLVSKSFYETLGLKFNTVNFNIEKLHGHYEPSKKVVEETTAELLEQQEESAENYHEPVDTAEQEEREPVEVVEDKDVEHVTADKAEETEKQD
ncbi:MAG: hypothetical protein NC132_03640 [Corallococcus sp.]|nr:hypothetical protein [Corallococcus sp.]MCM1359594.1 hypothetical protein [Corallococcus sp.]MCM1395186.1 hypothetical protein [Corallococcus sp.]